MIGDVGLASSSDIFESNVTDGGEGPAGRCWQVYYDIVIPEQFLIRKVGALTSKIK